MRRTDEAALAERVGLAVAHAAPHARAGGGADEVMLGIIAKYMGILPSKGH